MHVLNDGISNNSVKNCARHIIFRSKWPVEYPLEHTIHNIILIFRCKVHFVRSRHNFDVLLNSQMKSHLTWRFYAQANSEKCYRCCINDVTCTSILCRCCCCPVWFNSTSKTPTASGNSHEATVCHIVFYWLKKKYIQLKCL